ncbi:g2108 [Coccomyxa elongata]
MYADTLIGPPGSRGRSSGGKGKERYSRQVDELDYIVPRGGYYFEHDDRDVWNPKRGHQQQGGDGFRPRPTRYPEGNGPPRGDRHNGFSGSSRGGERDRYNDHTSVMSRIGGPSSRALPPSPVAERSAPLRERERSPAGRSDRERAAERRRPRETTDARPRNTIRSQVHYEGKVSSASDIAAAAHPRADSKVAHSRQEDAQKGRDVGGRDAHGEAATDQRQVSTARGDRGREPGGTYGRFPGRISSQVVGFDRLQQLEQPQQSGEQQRRAADAGRGGNGVFERLGGPSAAARPEQHRPWGGMRADAGGKWGHDLFETVKSEPDKPNLLRRSILF